MSDMNKNWAGNYHYKSQKLFYPHSLGEISDIVKANKRVKVLGSRHSFNGIVDTEDTHISLRNLNAIQIDETNQTVTVGAGLTYGDIAPVLHEAGFALHNLASLPHISVVGACATATHGSGMTNGNLATVVTALEFVSGTGEVVKVSRDENPDTFSAYPVGLGAFGIVTSITLAIQSTYNVQQDVYLDLPLPASESHFEDIMKTGYSVSLFTDWRDDYIRQAWLKRRVDSDNLDTPDSLRAARPATRNYHPITNTSAENCTPQMGQQGAWHERLPHFRMGFTPSKGEELQSEYFVPRQVASEAITSLNEIRDIIAPHLMVCEFRTIAADDLWLSPCYGQDCVAFHFTWVQDWQAVQTVLPHIEAALNPFGAIPHWGKLFTMPAQTLQSRHKKLADFRALAQQHDPQGKFRNDFLDTYVFNEV